MRTWVIGAGKHYASGLPPGIHLGKDRLRQHVKFNASCLYKPWDWENDTNKGCGFKYSFFNDKNSIRWGWRPNELLDTMIQVCVYVHENGVVKVSDYIDVYTDEWYEFDLYLGNGQVWLEVMAPGMHQAVKIDGVNLKPKAGWKNRPYFGGNLPAIHRTVIYTKDI